MFDLTTGQSLNRRFTLIRPLGRRGMAEVWLVRDEQGGEQLVAKILPADVPADRIEALQRQCQAARRLAHPNIVPVFDFHRGHRHSFLTMGFLPGDDIGRFRCASPGEIIRMLLQVADALEYAHQLGVVHRDLKVGNIVCDSSGRPHLDDFGIAGLLEDPQTGAAGGCRFNMSPQQLAGDKPHPSDDIYAFGVLLYELITGNPPFWPAVTEAMVRSETPGPLRSIHSIADRLQDLVAAMLSKSPKDRPAGMAAVMAKLREILEEYDQDEKGSQPFRTAAARLVPPPRIQPIEPTPAVSLPGGTRADADSRNRRSIQSRIALLGLAAVVVGLFLLLPRWAERFRDPADSLYSGEISREGEEPGTAIPPPTPIDTEVSIRRLRETAYLRQRAEEAARRAANLNDSLVEKEPELWGGGDFAFAVAAIEAGDRRMAEKNYSGAETDFLEAARLLEAVDGRSLQVLGETLEEGNAALAAGDATAAAAAFRLALKIDPNSRTAAAGYRRAEVLDEVRGHLEAGDRLERNGDLAGAESSYRQAATLDPLSPAAQASLARAQARISDNAFASAMSVALAALHKGDFPAARDAFQRAGSLKPGSAQVSEGLMQIEEGEKLAAINRYRDTALDHEKAERWREAAREYAAVLGVDPIVRFAQMGKERSERRADLAERLDFHISHPDRLSSDPVFQEASELLHEASWIVATGPRLRGQIERLEALLDTMGIRVRVFLESDNFTEVTVYQVGRLGSFLSRELRLRPGTYTVVGSRRGFRDVRRQLVVVPGEQPEPLMVRCEEEI